MGLVKTIGPQDCNDLFLISWQVSDCFNVISKFSTSHTCFWDFGNLPFGPRLSNTGDWALSLFCWVCAIAGSRCCGWMAFV